MLLRTNKIKIRLKSGVSNKYKIDAFYGQYFSCSLSKMKYNQRKFSESLARLFYAHVIWQYSLQSCQRSNNHEHEIFYHYILRFVDRASMYSFVNGTNLVQIFS